LDFIWGYLEFEFVKLMDYLAGQSKAATSSVLLAIELFQRMTIGHFTYTLAGIADNV